MRWAVKEGIVIVNVNSLAEAGALTAMFCANYFFLPCFPASRLEYD